MVYFKVLLNNKRPKADNIYPVVVRVTHNRNTITTYPGCEVASFVKPMNAAIANWCIADNQSYMANLLEQLPTENAATYQPVLPYPIPANAKARRSF